MIDSVLNHDFYEYEFFFYSLHGLNIKTAIPLPWLKSNETIPDLIIRFDELNQDFEKVNQFKITPNVTVLTSKNTTRIKYRDIDICTVKNNNEIVVNPYTGLKDSFLMKIILGSALPIILQKKGNLVLHANAIKIKDKAAIFIGPQGVGKSTISSVLVKKGYSLISDDIVTIEVNEKQIPQTFNGVSTIDIRQDVVKNLARFLKSSKKDESNYYSENVQSKDSIPIKKIYSVKKSTDDITIEHISYQKSAMELVKSTLWAATLFNRFELSQNLDQCTQLACNVPVKILKTKHSFSHVPTLVEIIEDDFFSIS